MAKPLDAIVCAASTDAAVRISDEGSLEKTMGIVEKKVVYNPVSEIGSKDLAEFGVGDDEASGGARCVAPLKKLGGETLKVVIKTGLKKELIGAGGLVTTCAIVRAIEVREQMGRAKSVKICGEWHRETRMTGKRDVKFCGRANRTHRETIVTVVVVVGVAVARVEVEVPGVVGVPRVELGRPVVTVRALVVEVRVPPVASSGQEENLRQPPDGAARRRNAQSRAALGPHWHMGQ